MTIATAPTADLDLSDPSFLSDPYPSYTRLRAQGLQWSERQRSWLAADYQSVVQVSTSPDFVRGPAGPGAADDANRTLQRVDGAEHARLQSAVAGAFRGSSVRCLAARVERVADDLVADCAGRPEPDLMAELAHPLAIRTLALVMGLPGKDLGTLTAWTAAMAGSMCPAASTATRAASGTARAAIADYVAATCEARRRQPRDDLVSGLVVDRGLSHGEALAMVRLLLCTGSHPMALALGNALLSLARRRNGGVPHVGRAVEECLRFDPVIQLTSRRAVAATELAGQRIPAGDAVVLLSGSANRDESVFSRADEFDVTRDPNPHLTFGRGTHACLAPLLARIELSALLTALARRRAVILPIGEPTRLTSPVLRGLERLPARLVTVDRGR